ncbi:type IV pilus secretin PilQ [Alteromonas sp. a30]|uniref:type IV pilus secretin PilQ n=1 Tax=Alteromonas sp. a30 TaxID=2730917 RepID=UPI00227E619A|nr:type IV pilus secretin PilQ family protein [Alteromonas sp. a30]MCY7295301.1 type IV pilus secretin PilQ family protein [Alteromonas sp. a30]
MFESNINHYSSRTYSVSSFCLLIICLCVSSTLLAQETNLPTLVNPEQILSEKQNTSLVNIDFERFRNEQGRTQISLSDSQFQMIVSKNNTSLSIDFPNVKLAKEQLYRLNVKDFGTIVESIETFEDSRASRVVITTNAPFDYHHNKENKNLIIDIKPKAKVLPEKIDSQKYTGSPISLDFQDVPVRQVLQIIAQVNGFNLVTTDTVTGNVTINLNQVPWDQALSMILKIKGLDQRKEGNILLIAPAEELAARETQQLQSQKQVADLAPLRTHNIQINYAKASELAPILKSKESSILSTRGSVTVDERTNSLIIRDTQESIDNAINMVQILDIPVRQVLIESRMVTVRDGVDEQIGVRWGFTDQQDSDGISGSIEGAETVGGGEIPDVADRLNVNLPVNNPAGRIGISVARLIDGTILDLELSALESENKGEIIASPRITVANQHEAYIEQGTEIPYVQSTSSGATSVTFKKAVLSMKVIPHITPDNRVILDLVVTQDTRGETVSTPTGPAVAIDTQEISTQVLVENGETIVLGGIFQQTTADTENKVPVLGDLPAIGRLFKNSQQINDKRELLIFVTPKILSEAL